MTKDKNLIQTLRWILGITLACWASAFYEGFALARELQVSLNSVRWMGLSIAGGAGLLVLIALLTLTWTRWQTRLLGGITRGNRFLARLRPLHLPMMILLAGVFLLILLPPYPAPLGGLLSNFSWRAFPFWMVTVVGAAILQVRTPGQGWWFSLGVSALIYGVAYRIAAFLPDISTYPFSLTWSEASRYYYASLFFSDQVYGIHANPTVLHPTRYLMQAVPFLISGLPIWVHRAWQVILWVSTNGLAAWMVARRMKTYQVSETQKVSPVLVALWAFLFLFQGPVWYHLVVIIIIVLWGTDTSRFWKTLLVVIAASVWGGISRVNWIPFPAVLAGMIYLLEREKGQGNVWRYLLPPFIWGLAGTAAGLFSQAGYAVWSGNDVEQFGSAFMSDLLWYRLFPSATYPLGVIPGIVLVSLPVIWLGLRQWMGQRGRSPVGQVMHPVRWLGVSGVLGVFFAGGLVVSAKIGGGSNLQNLDGYLALLLVAAVYAIFGQVKDEREAVSSTRSLALQPWLLSFAVLIPILFALDVGRSYDYDYVPKPGKVENALAYLNGAVDEVTSNGGEVLFISERQLLIFGDFNAALVPEYERVFLMEMAMSKNAAYLGQFEEDLRSHRFALIITSPVQTNIQNETNDFGEENNAWVEHVNVPLLCFYQQKERLRDVRVEILEPRENVECPTLQQP